MPEFKLIAITALNGCSSEFSKKLKIGHPYQFYKDYTIKLEDSADETRSVVRTDRNKIPDNLYKLNNGISLTISSVVGKNGTGKSTLMELLYQVIYRLAVQEKFYETALLHSPTVDLQVDLETLKSALSDLCKRVSYLNPKDYGLSPNAKPVREGHGNLNLYLTQLISKYRLDVTVKNDDSEEAFVKRVAARLKSNISDVETLILQTEGKEKRFESSFNVSLIYEVHDEIREIQIKAGDIKYFYFTNDPEQKMESGSVPNLEDLFYTISLNYSHHGLNSKVMGIWVNKLFHKNDAYRTPLVLNPMRDEGNFNINHEIKLSNERLMSTLIYDLVNKKENWILDKYKISSFIFTPKFPHLHNLVDEGDFNKLPFASIIKKRYKIPSSSIDLPHAQIALSYLNRKIGKVVEKYNFLFHNTNDSNSDLDRFLADEKDSHITKKIKQTANYLCRSIEELNPIWNKTKKGRGPEIHLSPKELLTYMDLFKPEAELGPSELTEYALPGFFNIDFEFQERDHKKIRLSAMSSGEQQMIFNVNAIMYHLYNLESVHKSKEEAETKKINTRPAYPNVNIVLDEMELYYHPEMQRRFVADMIKAFKNLRPGKIKAINVCILTHSPFILSDIPLQNILRLTDGSLNVGSENRQTFASNIHELLRKEFMLEKGFFGEYARQKIEQVIHSLKIHKALIELGINELSEEENIKDILSKDKEFKDFDLNNFLTEKECRELISLVGEPVLYKSLMEFYSEVFPKKKKDFIDEQIEMLTKLRNR
ncbi:AAA family ATPase [Chryseobacterium cucumeris]|uniref:AAA family ATPase n=1 Tax=Chryseobacterium cucumeris TaxID=1813611 RepID=UPI003D971131